MNKIFFPESIAVFGVSETEANLARTIVENLLSFGFRGEIYLIGRKRGFLGEKKIQESIFDLEAVPDLAVLLIPADTIPLILEHCGEKGIRRAVIETAGFSELGEERKSLEREIKTIASKWDMKIVGPNCVGVINLENRLVLPFYPVDGATVREGGISLISQSGGLLHDLLNRASTENFGLNKLASIGNKLLLDENDFLEYFISDPGTEIIGLYLENIKDGRRLMDLARSTDKPIVMLKGNRSKASRQIAQFHTSALAGDDEVADAAFRQCGIHRAQDLVEMVDWFRIFTLPPMKGSRVFLISRSGGKAVLLADAVYRYKFELARLSQAFFAEVRQRVRAGVINATNPLDLGDLFDMDFCVEIVEKVLAEDSVDGLVIVHEYAFKVETGPTLKLVAEVNRLSRIYRKPVLLSVVPDKEDWFLMKEATDLPLFPDGDAALKALAVSRDHARLLSNSARRHRAPGNITLPPVSSSPSSGLMEPHDVFALLASHGLPVADYALATSHKEALQAAARIGYPVALKTALPHILHKTEKKGVHLNLADEASLLKALHTMETDAYLVQKMAPQGHEVFIGAKRDVEFGHVLLFGLGGIFVEVFRDTAIRVLPVDEEMARDMIDELQGSIVLKGFRGSPPADLTGITRCLVAVSDLVIKNPDIISLDINPLIVFGENRGCVAVDAKIERQQNC